MYYHPTDQNGRPIPHSPRYKRGLYRFFVRDTLINDNLVTTFYSNAGIHFVGQIGDENGEENWEIEIDDNVQPLEQLGDLFNNMHISKKEKAILEQTLEEEWYKMNNRQ
jgi:hypothetical protein